MLSLSLDIDLQAAALAAVEKAAQLAAAAVPVPDPQVSVARVADILGREPETIRSYFALPTTHPRRLPYVRTSDDARGDRVRLSDVAAWQERNLQKTPEQAAAGLTTRPAHRRAA